MKYKSRKNYYNTYNNTQKHIRLAPANVFIFKHFADYVS